MKIVVLSGGITKSKNGKYVPTSYEDSDQFGMLGGKIRIMAAVSLFLDGKTRRIYFIGGRDTKKSGGENIPATSKVYLDHFNFILKEMMIYKDIAEINSSHPQLQTIGSSSNTMEDMNILSKLVSENPSDNFVVITNRYHVPRTKTLYERLITNGVEDSVPHVTFYAAEDVLMNAHPGIFNKKIKHAYASEAAKKRIKNEETGLRDLLNGVYSPRK